MQSTTTQPRYGGFRIGGMELGLPMEALREVLPCGVLAKLPCTAPCVIGGIDRRGMMVPVIDLRIALGITVTPMPFPSVIVMVHENKLLGLLTEAVTGVFTGDTHNTNRVSFATTEQSIFCGSIHRSDDGTLVNLLAPTALAMIKDVPMVEDLESKCLTNAAYEDNTMQKNQVLPMLLMRCGRIAFAIDAMTVYTTLSDPVIERSAMAMGNCRGVINYAGNKIPVLDLMSFCGFGKLDLETRIQAFVILLPEGMVAFLVSKVIDVMRIGTTEIISMPAYALPRPALFSGALPKTALPNAGAQHESIMASQYLVLDGTALKTDSQVVALTGVSAIDSSINVKHSAQLFTENSSRADERRNMITYTLGGETASPFEQIREILPFTNDIPILDQGGPMLGMVVVRGRSIPVVCLSRLVLGRSIQISSATSVLVVEINNEAMGFAIPALKSIEPAQWESELPQFGGSEQNSLRSAIHSNRLVQVGESGSPRMLPILDLEKIASAFRVQQLASA